MSEALFGIRVIFFLQRLLFDFELCGSPFQLINLCGHGIDLDAQRGGGFIDQIDSFVRQEAVGYITMRQSCGRDDG